MVVSRKEKELRERENALQMDRDLRMTIYMVVADLGSDHISPPRSADEFELLSILLILRQFLLLGLFFLSSWAS